MLTSPVNVAIALGGATLKPHAAPSDPHARKEQPPLAQPAPTATPDMVIEPELPSNSLMTNVNAVAATAGNRTILQELTLNIAAMLKVARRQDESLTSLFMRIIATIEKMPQAERLQLEIRSGLKGLKITLAELAAALHKPDGPEAARLTAMAEAPLAVPGRTAAGAATSTYLQEGTADGHAEETLAMRAAARSSAAGQNVFTAESRVRHADTQPNDGKVLQAQLKTMFESGAAKAIPTADQGTVRDAANVVPRGDGQQPLEQEKASDGVASGHRSSQNGASEKVALSASNLRLDAPALARIRTAAQAIADGLPESLHTENGQSAAEKADSSDRRPTLLTLKGLVEVVSALPAKAVEILATMPSETAVPTSETTANPPEPIGAGSPVHDEEELPQLASMDEPISENAAVFDALAEAQQETLSDEASALPVRADAQAGAGKTAPPADRDLPTPPRLDLAQHGVPYAYAPLPPAREPMGDMSVEEETRGENDGDTEDGGEEDREERRPRDEYDEIHDPSPEEEPTIVINRDSSEADRAFALYQRMGGF
jgi:hypothetical protein